MNSNNEFSSTAGWAYALLTIPGLIAVAAQLFGFEFTVDDQESMKALINTLIESGVGLYLMASGLVMQWKRNATDSPTLGGVLGFLGLKPGKSSSSVDSRASILPSMLAVLVVGLLLATGGCAARDLANTARSAPNPLDRVELLAGAAVETYREVSRSMVRAMRDPNVPMTIKRRIAKADQIATPIVLKLEPAITKFKELRAAHPLDPVNKEITDQAREVSTLTEQAEAASPALEEAVGEAIKFSPDLQQGETP